MYLSIWQFEHWIPFIIEYTQLLIVSISLNLHVVCMYTTLHVGKYRSFTRGTESSPDFPNYYYLKYSEIDGGSCLAVVRPPFSPMNTPLLSLASLARRTPQPQQAFLGKSPHKAGAMLSLAGVTSRDKTGARDSPFMLHLWCQAFCWDPPPSLLPCSFVATRKK